MDDPYSLSICLPVKGMIAASELSFRLACRVYPRSAWMYLSFAASDGRDAKSYRPRKS